MEHVLHSFVNGDFVTLNDFCHKIYNFYFRVHYWPIVPHKHGNHLPMMKIVPFPLSRVHTHTHMYFFGPDPQLYVAEYWMRPFIQLYLPWTWSTYMCIAVQCTHSHYFVLQYLVFFWKKSTSLFCCVENIPCAVNWIITGSDNGSPPAWCPTITYTNDALLPLASSGTNPRQKSYIFSEIKHTDKWTDRWTRWI